MIPCQCKRDWSFRGKCDSDPLSQLRCRRLPRPRMRLHQLRQQKKPLSKSLPRLLRCTGIPSASWSWLIFYIANIIRIPTQPCRYDSILIANSYWASCNSQLENSSVVPKLTHQHRRYKMVLIHGYCHQLMHYLNGLSDRCWTCMCISQLHQTETW